jgi:acyl phosphate:glycerol-3-phosphate acyltransferase
MILLYSVLSILAAYLLGSVSSAILVCRIFKLPDPRTQGSNNPGATNVMRIGGKLPAAITLIGDALKGFIPVYIVKLLGLPDYILGITLLAAFLGHLFPMFFSFKGGKGFATYLGGGVGLSWVLGLGMVTAWLTMFFLFRISSVAALFTVVATPVLAWSIFKVFSWNVVILIIISLLVIYTHRGNIDRIISGKEG